MLLSPDGAGPRVVVVCGKGGVGKTSVASALAVTRARAGARVLVVSTDPAHNLGHVWDREVGDEPTRVVSYEPVSVDALEVDPYATADRHLAAAARLDGTSDPDEAAGHDTRSADRPGSRPSS